MKTIAKREKKSFKVNTGTTKEPVEATVKDVLVQTQVPEEDDIAGWFDGDDAHKNERAQVLYLLSSQLLQHQGDSAFKSLATEVAKGKATRTKLDNFVYEHDFSKEVGARGEGQSAEDIVAKLVGKGMTAADIAALVAKVKAQQEEKEDETE